MTKSINVIKAFERVQAYGYEGTRLDEVYGYYSCAKENAYNRCLRLMAENDGYDGGIISHNTFMFTYGFRFVNKETGKPCFAYITPSYVYYHEV